MENNINENIQEWLNLSNQGLFVEAKNFYFNNLFDNIIERFVDKTSEENRCDVLFSILGFTPEPIILTQRALAPNAHVIFTTNKNYDNDNEIISYLEKYLTSSYKIVNLPDDSFETIYENLKAQMNIYPSAKYVIDITGGKKSMVASAAIFAKDYNCSVVYVDYDNYIPELRRPMPGTEKLNVVYYANKDIINTIDFNSIDENIEAANNKPTPTPTPTPQNEINSNSNKPSVKLKTTQKILDDSLLKNSFNETFSYYVNISKKWLPNNTSLVCLSERSIMLRHKRTGDSVTIQRTQLYEFLKKCRRNHASALCYISGTSQRAENLNPAIYGLLSAINKDLFKGKI